MREKPPAGSAAGADDTSARSANDSAQASGQELVYIARVSLDRTQMEVKVKMGSE